MSTPDLHRLLPTALLGDIRAIQPITVGLSGASVYAVSAGRGDFILRVQHGDRAAWEQMLTMQRLAAAGGVAPQVVHADADALATVSVKVPGESFGRAVAQPAIRPAAFGSLVGKLAKLHAIPADGLPIRDPISYAQRVWDAQAKRPGFPSWALPLGTRIDAAAARIAQDPRKVFSHCDLNPVNLLWDGHEVWLIDWEAAGLAHPYLDLAILANFLVLPDEPALGLLGAQERAALGEEARSLFTALRDLARIIYGAIFFGLVPELSAVAVPDREETPVLTQCYAMLAAGELVMSEPRGQVLMGAALLKQCEP